MTTFFIIYFLARGIFMTGVTITSAGCRVPGIIAKNLVSIIFCEAVAIYGIIISLIIGSKIQASLTDDFMVSFIPCFVTAFWRYCPDI